VRSVPASVTHAFCSLKRAGERRGGVVESGRGRGEAGRQRGGEAVCAQKR